VFGSERALLTAWAVVAAIAIGVQLGGYPLLDADEGRNAEVSREMAATNDYVMPRLDGLPYLDKPIVFFAAAAAAMEFLGPTEFAARLPAWLFTILTALLVAWFAARVGIDPPVAAIMFLSAPLTIAFARTVIFDSALSLFITAALIAFYLACHPDPERSEGKGPGGAGAAHPSRPLANARGDKGWSAIAWAAMALGVITKGPVAIAVPLIVAVPYAIWHRRSRALWSVGGLLLFVGIIAPWVWAISRAVPDFLQYVLVTETAQRLTTGALRRTGPAWYFLPFLIGGALPWMAAFTPRRPADWLDRFLILWIAVPFVFFSLSQSKRPQYILPLMPAVALFVARRWKGSRAAAMTLAAFGALLLIAAPMAKLRAEYADAAQTAAMVVGVFAVVCGVIGFATRPAVALIALSIPALALPLATNPLMNALALRRSTKAFVAQLKPYTTGAEVIGVEAFSGSMAFYLRQPIVIVTPDGEELTSNYTVRHYSRYAKGPLRPPSWLSNAFDRSRPRLFIVRSDDRRNRALVEQHGARLVVTSARFVAYTMPR
jgi:4-amino-4-deoxy-L-arabinose transferase-like glycosyltransferase